MYGFHSVRLKFHLYLFDYRLFGNLFFDFDIFENYFQQPIEYENGNGNIDNSKWVMLIRIQKCRTKFGIDLVLLAVDEQ